MMRSARLFTVLPGLFLLAGCAAEQEEGAGTMTAAAAVQEIPVTTVSEDARTAFMEGQHALDMGRWQEARTLFVRAAELDPGFTLAYVNLTNTASSAGEFMRNLKRAEAGMATASEGEQLLAKIARTFVDVDVAKRLQLSEALVEAYPTSPRAWLALAEVQASLERIEDARASITNALKLDAEFAPTHIALGYSFLFSEPKDFVEAERHMGHAVELEPEEANMHIFLGDAYRAQKRLAEARDAYGRAAELDPENALAHSKKGHADTFLGNYDAARSDFERAVETATGLPKVSYAGYKALVRAYAGDPAAAVEELGRVYDSIERMGLPEDRINNARIDVLSSVAMLAMHHGMFDAAASAIAKRAEHVRANAEVIGDDDFTRAQEANITLWDGLLAAYRGDFAGARMKAEELAGLVEPQTNPRKLEGYHSLLGLIELKAGDPEAAVGHYRQANLNNVIVKHHYALALEGADEPLEANRLFNEIADFNFNNAAYACVRNEAIRKAGRGQV